MKTSATEVNFMFTNSVSTIDKMPSVKSKGSDDVSFTGYMNTAGKSVDNAENDQVNKTQTTIDKPGRKDLDNQQTDSKCIDDTEKNPVSELEEKTTEIKDAIKDKFGVSDEDIEAAMETLNLSMVDLLNPDSLKDLMMSLTGQEDTISLLTNEDLYSDMMDIINLASDLTEEIKSDLVISDEELNNLMSEVKAMDTANDIPTEETEVKAPNIEVEINISEETRTQDAGIGQIVENSNSKQTQNSEQQGFNESAAEEMPQMTQTVQTETVTVSDAVETVRHFSSYMDGNDVITQVTDFIKVNISPETTSMELQLHPASLGTVNLNIVSQNGVVTAQLLVQTESVKEALEAQMIQLQETFDEQGTKVEAVEVAVASYDLDRGPFQDRDDRQDRQNADKGSHKRVNLNLNNLDDDDLSNLDEEDQLARRVMEMNGTSIDFSA